MRAIVRFLLVAVLLSSIALRAAVVSSHTPEREAAPETFVSAASTASYSLYGDARFGWGLTPGNMSNPGPTLLVASGGNVSLALFSVDGMEHEWFFDANGNGVPDASEPTSPLFSSSIVPTWLNFTATFPAGNYTYYCAFHPSSMRGTFVVQPQGDGTPPVVVVALSGPAGGGGWYRGAVSATLTAFDNDSGVQSLLYSEDGVTWNEYTGPLNFYVGVHTLEYYAIDVSGSVAPVRTIVIRVDSIPPFLTVDPVPGTVTVSAVTISWSASDSGSGVSRYEVRVDGGPSQKVGTNRSFAATFDDGAHTVQVSAFDVAGNEANETVTFRVDTNAFSPSGPYGGLPTYALILAAVAAAGFVLWRRKNARIPPPSAPPPPPAGP